MAIIAEKPDQARPYFQRANELLSAISNRTEVAYEAVWLQLYPGYQAWMNDDVAIASRES